MAIQTHYDRYKELEKQYKITRCTYSLVPVDKRATMSPEEKQQYINKALEAYDIAIEHIGQGYAHAEYRVVKNEPGLSTEDLAIICDNGNLCFGYRTEGPIIYVYID